MKEEQQAGIVLRFLGRAEVSVNGSLLPSFPRRKDLLLLPFLALTPGKDCLRLAMGQELWSPADVDDYRFLDNVRFSLCRLRKALGEKETCLIATGKSYLRLDTTDLFADTIAFQQAIGLGDTESLQKAVALYKGPFLPEYPDLWVDLQRRTYQKAYLDALHSLSAQARSTGDYEAVIDYLRLACKADPRKEETLRVLMKALAEGGNINEACQAYLDFQKFLQSTYRLSPEADTKALFEKLKPASPPARHVQEPPPVFPSPPLPDKLPRYVNTFVGREEDTEGVRKYLKQGVKLVTLVGAGGVGKTRLAIQIAEQLKDTYPDGVGFVPLAALNDPNLLPQAFASALELQEERGLPLEQAICEYLQRKRMLLILDNCEHLLAACAAFTRKLLDYPCPNLQILVTSRQSLGIMETICRVSSLSAPNPNHLPKEKEVAFQSIGSHLAIELFIERVRATRPSFRLTPENVHAIAQICYRLDGIPLAIELAAAHVGVLSPAQIAARLDKVFALLTNGDRTALPRQQTLHATINWSFELLLREERTLLKSLCVFQGDWTLEAAEFLADTTSSALPLLTSLLDKSLIQVVPESESEEEIRYRMLETVREFCREQWQEEASWEPLRQRHGDYFVSLANTARNELRGPQQLIWIARLEADHDNLRLALDTCCQQEDKTAALELAGGLAHFWDIRGYPSEGRLSLMAALQESDTAHEALRARAMIALGILSDHQGESSQAIPLVEEGLRLAQQCGDRWLTAHGLTILGHLNRKFQPELARTLLQQALPAAKETGDPWLIADALSTYAWFITYVSSPNVHTQNLFMEALHYAREAGDRWLIDEMTYHLGLAAFRQGQEELAWRYLQESLATQRELAAQIRLSKTLSYLATLAFYRKDYTAMREFIQESLTIAHKLENRRCLVAGLEGAVRLASALGQWERCATLLGTLETLGGNLDAPLLSLWRESQEECRFQAQNALGEALFKTFWFYGQGMALEKIVKFALETQEV